MNKKIEKIDNRIIALKSILHWIDVFEKPECDDPVYRKMVLV